MNILFWTSIYFLIGSIVLAVVLNDKESKRVLARQEKPVRRLTYLFCFILWPVFVFVWLREMIVGLLHIR